MRAFENSSAADSVCPSPAACPSNPWKPDQRASPPSEKGIFIRADLHAFYHAIGITHACSMDAMHLAAPGTHPSIRITRYPLCTVLSHTHLANMDLPIPLSPLRITPRSLAKRSNEANTLSTFCCWTPYTFSLTEILRRRRRSTPPAGCMPAQM